MKHSWEFVMYGHDDDEWLTWGGPTTQAFRWHKVPLWVFWRKKWYRRIYDGADRGAGWNIEYATDAEVLRDTLEVTFG